MNKDKKFIDFCLWFFAACALVILLTSCSPYAALYSPIATPSQAVTEVIPLSPVTTETNYIATPSQAVTEVMYQDGTELPTPSPITCTVTTGLQAGRVNLRSQPTTSARVLRVVIEAETLIVIDRGPWLQVIDAQGNQGFIYSKYCKE